MIAPLLRRLGVLLVGLALALGPLAHAAAALPSNMETPAVAANTAMSDGCDLCGDDAGATGAADCFVSCAASAAILPAIAFPAYAGGQPVVPLEWAAVADRHKSPDPNPPKSTI